MAGIRVEGATSGNVAEVNASNQLKVIPETAASSSPGNVGCIRDFMEVDSGSITGTAVLRSPRVSPTRRLRVGVDTLLFNEIFNATAQNTHNWAYALVTMTATLPGAGALQIGTVQGTAATHGLFMKTFQHFPVLANGPLRLDLTFGLFTATLVANEEFRFGLAAPTVAGTAPVDGIYFVLTTAGMKGAIIFNNVETQTAAFKTLASYTVGTNFRCEILVSERGVEFWQDGILMAVLAIPVGNGQPFQNASLPLFMQKLCTGAVANTNVIRVTDCSVHVTELATNKSWEAQLATAGQNGNIGQNGHTQGKTSIYANSTPPTAVALTNTTAAFTGLGGQAAVLPTLAVSSDGILFSYQNPAPTINITGRNLLIYGVTLSSHVSVVFDAAAAIVYQASLQYGHTNVSLATVETASFATATTHAPRVVSLGTISYGVALAAPLRTLGNTIDVKFAVPYVVRPGEFVAVVLKAGVGSVVTVTGAVTFMGNINAVFE